jgi:hypothetical protein
MVILAVSNRVEILITGYLSPTAKKYLIENGIKVIQGVRGTASEALSSMTEGRMDRAPGPSVKNEEKKGALDQLLFALTKTSRQFAGLLPVMAGVILLIGLFHTLLSREAIMRLFSGNFFTDAFWGTCLGSVLAGNPINSYLIGAGLLQRGVSLFGVTAFMVAWVSVGLLQLPAEIAALGKGFALARTGLSFCFAMAVSILTAGLFYLIGA